MSLNFQILLSYCMILWHIENSPNAIIHSTSGRICSKKVLLPPFYTFIPVICYIPLRLCAIYHGTHLLYIRCPKWYIADTLDAIYHQIKVLIWTKMSAYFTPLFSFSFLFKVKMELLNCYYILFLYRQKALIMVYMLPFHVICLLKRR